ncbi:MAG: T9SS type A sorting domain-containing protein, partial [Bacteroidales bacterium]|nr:T9SS type A sorting domain-containing protein [Bacteroidales bacterium]
PNPASVIVFIETQGVNSVELVNIEGKVVIEKEVNDAVTILNINQVNAGIYFLHLYIDNGKRHTEKILVH